MSSSSRLCGTFNMDENYMNTVLVISERESQLRKVKRKTSLSSSLLVNRGESHTHKKQQKRINIFKKYNLLSKKQNNNNSHPIQK
jgi:hypothetical protein